MTPDERIRQAEPEAASEGEVELGQEKQGTNWRAWLIGALIALAAIVALQNSQDTDLDILFINTEAPLIVILLIFLGIGAVIGYVGPLVRRHRREERRAEDR